MTLQMPSLQTLYDTIDATWPAANYHNKDGWLIREGKGGGKRVSAASMVDKNANIKKAEAALTSLGQDKLFMIKQGDTALDTQLDQRGYHIIDPVVFLAAPIHPSDYTTSQNNNAATDVMKDIWQKGGIGPDRIAIMNRANDPKYFCEIEASATAFSAIHNGICMTHAVEVLSTARRQGLGQRIMKQVQSWAYANGAHTLCVLTVIENTAARRLYEGLGMKEVGRYQYRIKK